VIGNRDKEGNFFCVGQVNCRFIREYLLTEGIPVVAEDLGGAFGRVIHFSSGDEGSRLLATFNTKSGKCLADHRPVVAKERQNVCLYM